MQPKLMLIWFDGELSVYVLDCREVETGVWRLFVQTDSASLDALLLYWLEVPKQTRFNVHTALHMHLALA